MSSAPPIHLSLDRRLLRHPRAYHLRRMRMGIWLYLDLLARLPAGAESIEVEPAVVAGELGVEEGFVRSWLGHLKKAGYVTAQRLNGKTRVTIRDGFIPEPPTVPTPAPSPGRFFTAAKLQRALGDHQDAVPFEAALRLHSDAVLRRALAGALAVPEGQVRRSRTALFFYLLKRHAHVQA
jgi:hypothetical protein